MRSVTPRKAADLARRLAGEAAYALDGLVNRLDPRPVEVLLAQLSLWYAAIFLISPSPLKPQPVWAWAGWCMAAGVLKLAGVLAGLTRRPPPRARRARLAGDFMGLIFWTTLAVILFYYTRGGIVWGGFGIIALAQAWCGYRAARGG